MELRIGCTGWSYEGWIGTFYPKHLASPDFLKFYSGVFDITEINSTFYRIPSPSSASKWFRETPDNFRFTAKLPKSITHEGRLKPSPDLDRFLTCIKPLGSKLVVIVIQLPPSLTFKEAAPKLEKMLDHLPNNYRYAIEGRHESWFSVESVEFCKQKNVCLLWNEIDGLDNPAPITSDFVYLRLIGDRSIPESEFGKIVKDRTDLIRKWVNKLKKLDKEVSFAIAMINNHFAGFAPATASTLREELGMEQLKWTDNKQKSLSEF